MSWFTRFDRFASAHLVRSQDKNMSCGLASMCMVNFKCKKGLMFAGMAAGAQLTVSNVPFGSLVGPTLARSAINYAFASEAEVTKLAEKAKGLPNDFNVSGLDMGLIPPVLKDLGLGNWECLTVGEAGVTQAVIDATDAGSPVILNLHWDGGGDHFVCVDETHEFFGTRYLCVCDPWDGELRLVKGTAGSTVKYDGGNKPISTGTLFGGDAHDYSPTVNNKGKFDGWIVRPK
jgi:hypothetical protein